MKIKAVVKNHAIELPNNLNIPDGETVSVTIRTIGERDYSKWEAAAKEAVSDYMSDPELTAFTALDSDTIYED